jgi:hypothetical protein
MSPSGVNPTPRDHLHSRPRPGCLRSFRITPGPALPFYLSSEDETAAWVEAFENILPRGHVRAGKYRFSLGSGSRAAMRGAPS